jgi:hypothetical protein
MSADTAHIGGQGTRKSKAAIVRGEHETGTTTCDERVRFFHG